MNIFDVLRNTVHDLTHEKVRVWRINRNKKAEAKAAEMSDSATSFLLTKRRVKALGVWSDKLGDMPLFLSDDPDILSQEVGVILTNFHISDSIAYGTTYTDPNWCQREIDKIQKRRIIRMRLLKTLANSIADVERKYEEIIPLPQEKDNV